MYHLTTMSIRLKSKISPFFNKHSFVLNPELEERIKEEGTQLIDLTPVDTALEAIARLPPAGAPIIRSWSAADTALSIFTIVGYIVTLTLTFLLHNRVNAIQESFNRCTSGVPRLFRPDKPDQEPEPENSTNLIEIMPIPPRRTPTIKPIKMTQLPTIPNNASLRLLKFLTCSFPNYPAPGFSQ